MLLHLCEKKLAPSFPSNKGLIFAGGCGDLPVLVLAVNLSVVALLIGDLSMVALLAGDFGDLDLLTYGLAFLFLHKWFVLPVLSFWRHSTGELACKEAFANQVAVLTSR